MADFDNDNEQIEKLKNLWKRFGNLILWLIIIVLGAFAVWTYWQHLNQKKEVEASVGYQVLQNDLQKGLVTETIAADANNIMQNYPKTTYASFAALLVAKQYVSDNNYQAAENSLQWVLDHSDDKAVLATANLRLARLYIAENKAQKALDLLNNAKLPQSYQVSLNLVLAQGYIQLANEKNARESLLKAKSLLNQNNQDKNDPSTQLLIEQGDKFIDMQLNNLSLLIAQVKAANQKEKNASNNTNKVEQDKNSSAEQSEKENSDNQSKK